MDVMMLRKYVMVLHELNTGSGHKIEFDAHDGAAALSAVFMYGPLAFLWAFRETPMRRPCAPHIISVEHLLNVKGPPVELAVPVGVPR